MATRKSKVWKRVSTPLSYVEYLSLLRLSRGRDCSFGKLLATLVRKGLTEAHQQSSLGGKHGKG